MTIHMSFALPAPGSGRLEREHAIAALNRISISVEQLRHGFGFLVAGYGAERVACMERLVHFCRSQGLYPSDVAAEAIAIRANWLRAYIEAGYDPEVDWAYEGFARRPISLEDLGADPEDEPDLDDEIPW